MEWRLEITDGDGDGDWCRTDADKQVINKCYSPSRLGHTGGHGCALLLGFNLINDDDDDDN